MLVSFLVHAMLAPKSTWGRYILSQAPAVLVSQCISGSLGSASALPIPTPQQLMAIIRLPVQLFVCSVFSTSCVRVCVYICIIASYVSPPINNSPGVFIVIRGRF